MPLFGATWQLISLRVSGWESLSQKPLILEVASPFSHILVIGSGNLNPAYTQGEGLHWGMNIKKRGSMEAIIGAA